MITGNKFMPILYFIILSLFNLKIIEGASSSSELLEFENRIVDRIEACVGNAAKESATVELMLAQIRDLNASQNQNCETNDNKSLMNANNLDLFKSIKDKNSLYENSLLIWYIQNTLKRWNLIHKYQGGSVDCASEKTKLQNNGIDSELIEQINLLCHRVTEAYQNNQKSKHEEMNQNFSELVQDLAQAQASYNEFIKSQNFSLSGDAIEEAKFRLDLIENCQMSLMQSPLGYMLQTTTGNDDYYGITHQRITQRDLKENRNKRFTIGRKSQPRPRRMMSQPLPNIEHYYEKIRPASEHLSLVYSQSLERLNQENQSILQKWGGQIETSGRMIREIENQNSSGHGAPSSFDVSDLGDLQSIDRLLDEQLISLSNQSPDSLGLALIQLDDPVNYSCELINNILRREKASLYFDVSLKSLIIVGGLVTGYALPATLLELAIITPQLYVENQSVEQQKVAALFSSQPELQEALGEERSKQLHKRWIEFGLVSSAYGIAFIQPFHHATNALMRAFPKIPRVGHLGHRAVHSADDVGEFYILSEKYNKIASDKKKKKSSIEEESTVSSQNLEVEIPLHQRYLRVFEGKSGDDRSRQIEALNEFCKVD